MVALVCEDSLYILRYFPEKYRDNLQAGLVDVDEGVQGALEEIHELEETVKSGTWVGDCFIFTNTSNRLNYAVGDKVELIAPFDKPMYVLGYIQTKGRVYLADKEVNIVSFSLSVQTLEYQTLILRGDFDTAASVLETIKSNEQRNKIARFLDGQEYRDMALDITTDPDHRFDLALTLHKLDIAIEIARQTDLEPRWKTVGDAAMDAFNLVLAEECFVNARDLGSLLLLYTAAGNFDGLRRVAGLAGQQGAYNVEFTCLWCLGDIDGCIDLLIRTKRVSEAVLFSRSYKPSRCREIVGEWKTSLETSGKSKASKMLAVPPSANEEGDVEDEATSALFPTWADSLKLEKEQDGNFEKPSSLLAKIEMAPDANGDHLATEEKNHNDTIA